MVPEGLSLVPPPRPLPVASRPDAEFDLSTVPAGGHDVRLLAWATDPGARLVAVSLPRLTFRQSAAERARRTIAHAISGTA
jgi:hypothetical protein